jgi:FkbM family methyltransferase
VPIRPARAVQKINDFREKLMVGKVKLAVQGLANRFGYQIRRQDKGVDLVDPYMEQYRILGSDIKTIFEIGAADGRDCVRYTELFSQSRVYAFEPVPESFQQLKQKAETCKRISVFNSALSDAPGTAEFHISNWIDSSSLLKPKPTGSTFDAYQASSKSISVLVDTIDHVCIREKVTHIDLLKMDAQGAELKILSGAKAMLEKNSVDMIFSEIHFMESYEGAARFDQIVLFLKNYGFQVHNIYGLNNNHRGQLTWGDALFVHESLRY